jgi:hypothetical protein
MNADERHFVLNIRDITSDHVHTTVEFDAYPGDAVDIARRHVRESQWDRVEGDLYISDDGALNNLGVVRP